MHHLEAAREFVGTNKSKFKGGPISGWVAEKNPWRDPKFQAAFMDSHNITLAALKASGLAPISELEFKNQAKRVFAPNLTWEQNMEALEKLEAMTLKAVSDHIQMQPQRNWNVAVGVMPKQLHGLLPKMEERRMELYERFAPQGVTPRGETTQPSSQNLPKDFLDFLGGLPSGKWAKAPNGKKYTMSNGVPVEVP